MQKRLKAMLAAMAVAASAILSEPALADDPFDPAMDAEGIARDRELTRELNVGELEYVRERDARYAQGWRDYDRARRARDEHAQDLAEYEARQADYERDARRYTEDRRRYEQAMADWRADVADCRAGYYKACAR